MKKLKKLPPRAKPLVRVALKFSGAVSYQTLEENVFQHLSHFATLYNSDNPDLKELGIKKLREVAADLARFQRSAAWRVPNNRNNAKRPREAARIQDSEELVGEFRRLCRQGHTAREARGIMNQWKRWTPSTIYRYTKDDKTTH